MSDDRKAWALAALYAAAFFALGADRYATHRSVEDLGIFVQSIASAGHGFTNTIEGQNHFAVHFSPVLYLVAPLLAFAHSALVLVAVQAIAGGLVAPPLYYIARRRASARIALAIAGIGLLYPPLGGVTFTEFHENGLAPAATLWLLYALDARRYAAAIGLACVTLAIKEDQSLFVGCVGLFEIVRARHAADRSGVRTATTIVALALLTIPLYFGLVRPLAGAHGPWHPLVFLHPVSDGARTGAVREVTDRLGYVALAFVPLLLLPFRSSSIVLALPGFAETLVSRAPVTYTMGQHYAAVWIPYVLAAFAYATCALATRDARLAMRLLGACGALCALVYLVANPLHPRYFLGAYNARDAELDRFLATLPQTLDVGTQEEAYTHLGFDPNATLGIECTPRYALFDVAYPASNWIARDGPLLSRAVAHGTYRLVRTTGAIRLYERRGPAGRLPGAPPLADRFEFARC